MPGLFRELKGQSSFAGDQAGAGKPRPKRVTKEEAEEEVVPLPSQVTSAGIMKEREEAIRKRTAELLMSKDTRPANAKMDRKMSHIEGVDADLLVKMLRSDGESSDRRQHSPIRGTRRAAQHRAGLCPTSRGGPALYRPRRAAVRLLCPPAVFRLVYYVRHPPDRNSPTHHQPTHLHAPRPRPAGALGARGAIPTNGGGDRFTINPMKSMAVQRFDGVIGIALIWTALATTLEIGFIPDVTPEQAPTSVLFWINSMVRTKRCRCQTKRPPE